MRVSSTMMVDNYLHQTNRVYESQTKLMEQSDGSKLHRPSDDSIGYSKYLRFTYNQVENDQYISGVKTGISWMKSTNAAIMDMEDCIKTVIDKTVQGANDTSGETDLKAIAAEMEAMVQQTVSDANMQIGNRYVLAGQNDKTQPFVTSEETIDRGVAKTLDEKQRGFFSGVATNSNGTAQMLTLKGSDGNEYYLDTQTKYIYTKDFVQNGYKDVIALGRSSVNPSLDAFGQLTGSDFTMVGDYFSNTGRIYAQLGQTGADKPVTPIGGGSSKMPSMTYVAAKRDFAITYANGLTVYSDGSNNAGIPITSLTKATDYTPKADGSIVFNNGVEVRSDGKTKFPDGTVIDINGTVTDSSGTVLFSGTATATPTPTTPINPTGVDVNGVNMTFATVSQKIVTYNGDYNYISMVKENGAVKPDSDTVNVNAADVFGTDIFDNELSGNKISGTAGINQLYTIVAKADNGDSHWLSSDGITVANAVYDKALVAQTKVAARLSVYNDVSSMLEEHGLTITDDISAVADTDVAQLSVLLNTITTIYSMSLAVGSRVLPMSLADYL